MAASAPWSESQVPPAPEATLPAQAISAEDWLTLLDAVAAGGVHLLLRTERGSKVALLAEQELLDLQEAAAKAEATQTVLTARERQVLLAVEEGLQVSDVAERLGIAHGTAVQHLAATRRKYGVRTSTQAAARAREAGDLA